MRTWLLAPDGVWVDVTVQVPGHGPEPARWSWPEIVAEIGGEVPVRFDLAMGLDRGDLVSVHGNVPDRWVANLIWSTLCTDRVDAVTVLRITPLGQVEWLDALRAWVGRPTTDRPPVAWQDRRARWMLWAHATTDGPVPLDNARIVVGAVHS